jgi:chromosome segregation ATPase
MSQTSVLENAIALLESQKEILISLGEEMKAKMVDLQEELRVMDLNFIQRNEQIAELEEKISLVRQDDAMSNRMFELFETRRQSDEAVKFYQTALTLAMTHLKRLTRIGPPSQGVSGPEYAAKALQDNCEFAEKALEQLEKHLGDYYVKTT